MHLILTMFLSLQAPAAAAVDQPGVRAAGDTTPAQTPSGTRPAVPGERPAEPAQPEKPSVPENKPAQPAATDKAAQQPAETASGAKPSDTPAADQVGQPPGGTPSGTQPAEPAVPGETSAKPAEPGKDKGPKTRRERPDRSAMSKAAKSLGLPSGAVPPAAAAAPAVLGKKEKPAEVVQASTAAAAEPLYSQGEGPALAVLDFEGERGAEFAGLLSEALKPGRKVYSREALAGRKYGAAVTRLSAKKIAAETGAAYLVAGKISLKTDSLCIVSVVVRDGASGDMKGTDFVKIKSLSELPSAASPAAGVVAALLEKLKN